MHWDKQASLLLALALGFLPPTAFEARGQEVGGSAAGVPAVESGLAVRLAEAEANQKWPGSRFLSVVPYYDPSGNVTAWAVQFAKAGSAVGSEKDLLPLLAERLSAKAKVLAGIEGRGCGATEPGVIDPRDLVTRGDGATTEALGLSITVRPEVLAGARARQEQESLESERDGARQVRENAALLAAIRAGNLADDVGTVVVSAREDLYPILELHSGPAAHLKFSERMAEVSGMEVSAVARGPMVERVIYAGQMTYWLEPTAKVAKAAGSGSGRWLDAESSEWIDGSTKRGGLLARGMPPAEFDEEVGKSPSEIWAEARRSVAEGGTVTRGEEKTPSTNSIAGVPFYFQSWYGRNSCGPTAFATTLGYWDTQGFGTLVDNGESLHDGPGNESHLVYYCMRDTGYDPDLGTWPDWDPIESGIRKVCEDTGYANFVDVHVTERTGVSFIDDVKDYIDKGRPLTYCWFIEPNDPTSGHWSTIVGYRDPGGSKYATLHNNWESYFPDGYELNLSNVLGTNEWCEKIRIDETPFDTPWSESWETCDLTSNGSCRGAWLSWCTINGVAQPYVGWMANDLRSHSRPYSPYPEYGGLTHSGKLTPPSYDQEDPYPPNFDSYLVYGPFSTLGRTSGELSAMFAIEIEDWQDDGVMMVASVDGVNWGGMRIGDPEGVDWFNAKLNMSSVPNVGNLMNRPRVWVGFYFHSDGDANTSRGPFVDNINIILRPRMPALPKPVNVQASQGLYLSKIDLSCPVVSGATHYQFLRWTPETGVYDPISGWIESPSFTDPGRVAGTTYYYRAKCADNPSGTNASEISDRADGWVGTRAPYNFNATQGGHTAKVVLTWWDTDNDSYTVQRSIGTPNGPWENRLDGAARASLLVDANQPSLFQWTDNSVSSDTDYYYRVRGARGPTTTAFTETQLGYTKLVNVSGITATSTATGVTLSWPGTAGHYYAVYHDTDTAGTPTRIRDFSTSPGYVHTISGAAGAYHYYYVRQARDASGKALSDYGSFANGYRINAKPTGVVASDGTSEAHVLVQWSPTSGATHYQVRAKNEGATTDQVVMNWSTATSFQDTAAVAGKLRTYTVKAASSATGFASGASSDADTGWKRLGPVQNIRATDGTRVDGVEVTWGPVSGAGAYRVSRFAGSASIGVIVSDWLPATVTFLDSSASVNTIYRYRVQAAADIQGNRAGSSPNEDTGYRGFGSPTGLSASDGTRTDAVTVSWNAIPGNVVYRVSRSTSQGGVYTAVSSWLTGTAYNDATALPGVTYWYGAEAASDASGTNATALGSKESGWRKLRSPAWLSASDGEGAAVNLSWEAVPGAEFYDVFYSTTVAGPKTGALTRVSATSSSFVPPSPATVYYFFAQGFVDPGTQAQQRSDFSPADSGWYSTESVSHPPNCANALGVISYIDGIQAEIAEVADDWTSPDGSPVLKVRWWGNYSQHASNQTTQVLPPRDAVEGFTLRLYTVKAGHPATPGTLLREARVDRYSETWSCAVPRYDNPSLREHQYRYEAELSTGWPTTQGTSYYLAVVARMADRPPANPWCWQSADTHTGEAAYYRGALTSNALAYPAGHPRATQPMSMAFELVSGPAVTPTPSPTVTATATPSPTPAPEGKWAQEVNGIDGRGHASYTEVAPATNNVLAADDWICPDGDPILKVRWWGAYPGWAADDAALVGPPGDGATAFVLSWYTATTDQVPAPDSLIGQETVSAFGEVAVATVHSRTGEQTSEYQHVYEYEATLATPWAQVLGQRYFLSIQAVHGNSWHATSWGWFGAESKNLSPAHVKADAGSDWTPQYYENYQRLWPGGIDLAFELSSAVPTPTPTPTPSPTLPPSATPTATPTPTPSPTATPVTMRFDRLPNLTDGLSRESWRTSGARGRLGTTPVRIGDDWQTTDDRPIDRVRWWGAYTGWQSSSAAPCAPPAGHPAQFELTWSNAAVGPPYQPGTATVAAVVSAFTETWVAAVERWDAPGTYLHVFRCEATLPAMWAAAPGQDYFLEARAVYPAVPTQNAWGWVSAMESMGHGGVEQSGAAPWTELTWPAGHRLATTPMDLAFQVMAVEQLPTATPSPTPPILPTSTPSPSVTPFGWTGSQPPNMVDGIDELSYALPDGTFERRVADDVTFDRDVTVGTLIWWGSYPGWRANTNAPGESPASLAGLIGNLDRPKERPVAYAVRLHEAAASGMGEPATLLSEQYLPGWNEEWAAAVPRFGHGGQWEHEYRFTAPLEAPLTLTAGTRCFVSIQAIYADPDPAYLWGWLGSAESHGSSAFTRASTTPWSALEWPAGHRLGAQDMDMAFELREGMVPTPTLTPTPTSTPVVTPSLTPAGWYSLAIDAPHGSVGRDPDQTAYAPGSTVRLIAKGNDGYAFMAWTGELATGQQDDNPLVVTMNSPRALSATFVLTPYALAATIDSGTLSIEPQQANYLYGTNVTVEALPSSGLNFDHWEMTGGELSENELLANPITFPMRGDVTLRAVTNAPTSHWLLY